VAIKRAPGLKTATMATSRAERAPCVCVCACSQHLQPVAAAAKAAAAKAAADKAADVVQQVLASAAERVDWPHCRLQVRGPGGVGKSSTIDAMSGKEFDTNSPSTAGARLTTCEVERRSLEVASEGRPLRVYNLADGETEHARAVAVAAQGRITESAKQVSEAEKAKGVKQSPVSVQSSPKPVAEKQKQAAELAAAAGKLVIKGAELPRLVLHIQDSGGQNVFLSVLDLLHAPEASVSILVFSLPDLQNPDRFKNSIAQLRVQLDSFAVHASESPLLLVGTRKDEAVAAGGGGDAALARLSTDLRKALTSARLAKVRPNGDLCFFPIENSKGFAGDETIRKLVGAIEEVAMELKSMKERVPAGWLAVYDELAREVSATPPRQLLSLADVTKIASRFGLPHDPARFPLEREVQLMLSYFHSLGAVCWYDLPEVPEVRELVVLDPQWIIDAVSMIICNFDDHDRDHERKYHKEARRRMDTEWNELVYNGKLHSVLLEILWEEDTRFKAHKAKLLKLMEHFGLVVPIRRKGHTSCEKYFVPALLAKCRIDHPPTTPTNAPLAMLHFALARQSSPDTAPVVWAPDTAPVWAPGDCERGFLPDGAFFELCGAAVGWSYDTAIGFEPALGCGFARVMFGQHQLLLSRPPDGAPYITVAILNAGEIAWSPAIDRLRLLVDGISSRFVNLRCKFLLPLSSVDEAEKRYVERDALIDGSPAYRDADYFVGGKTLKTRALATELSAYLPPLEPPDHYGAFLSYSHVPAFDTPFTEKLADCLGAQSPLVTTFLDKRDASRGSTDLDVVKLLAMANSRVIVPIVTWNALRRMTSLTSTSGLDYLLLEWSFALLQHEHGAAVLPIFIGASDADGSADPSKDLFKARPPLARADGWGNALDDAGRVQADVRSVWERVPDIVVESVARSLESLYTKHKLKPPQAIRTRTAREVVRSISEIWGETTWELTARAFTRKATRTLNKILGKTPSSSLFGAAGRAEPGVRTHELLGQVDGPCPWGLPEAIAQRVSKAVHDAEQSEPPKLLGQSKPAPPANEGETGKAIEAALLEKVMTSDDH
jgi:GTPase SAR1 family protein